MTEEEWLASTDFQAVMGEIGADASRHTLFMCACCRMLGDRLGAWGDRIITAFEAEARGGPLVPREHWDEIWQYPPDVDGRIRELMGRVREGAMSRVLWMIGLGLGHRNMDYSPFVPVARCVLGNPFHPLAKPPTDAMAALARRADADAVLADALEEAGELAAATHLRTGPHFGGCYVREWATSVG